MSLKLFWQIYVILSFKKNIFKELTMSVALHYSLREIKMLALKKL